MFGDAAISGSTGMGERSRAGSAPPKNIPSAAASAAAAVTISEKRVIPLCLIEPWRGQPRRREPESIEELARSLAENGQLSPILVRPRGESRYEVVAGERRYQAARLLGWKEIDCRCGALSDEEALRLALQENLQRDDLCQIDLSDALQEYAELTGYDSVHIGLQFGKSSGRVRQLLSLQKLHPEVRQAVREKLPARVAQPLSALEPEEQLPLLQRIREEGLTGDQGLVSDGQRGAMITRYRRGVLRRAWR